MADASGAAILGALALGLFAKDWRVALAGGAVGAALASLPQPLEFAVRNHLESRGLKVLSFYRAPRLVKVTFGSSPHTFWTVESLLPGNLGINNPQDRDDWLYGNLIERELPSTLKKVESFSR